MDALHAVMLLKCTDVQAGMCNLHVPCSMHDRFVLHIAESSNTDGVEISSQNTAIPDGCLHHNCYTKAK